MARELVLIPSTKYENIIEQLEKQKHVTKECKQHSDISFDNDVKDDEQKTDENQADLKKYIPTINVNSNKYYSTDNSSGHLSPEEKIPTESSSDRHGKMHKNGKRSNSVLREQSGGNVKRRKYVTQTFSTFLSNKPDKKKWMPYKI